jgi:hypothetical protein
MHYSRTCAQLPYFNNFALDPYRIQPMRDPPQQAPPHYGAGHEHGGRGNAHAGGHAYPPPYANGGGFGGGYDGYGQGHRGGGGRLSERLGGYDDPLPAGIGLPAKPMLDAPLSAGGARGRPPPPPDAKEDPRAAQGRRVSYHDMDLVAEGDVELQY